MKIIKYKKKTDGKYEITLENNDKINLYEDIILKEDLLWKKEIDDIESLLLANHDYEIYDVAYKYLNHHVTSIAGMQNYLERKGYLKDKIDFVIHKLVQKNLLNDEYYAKCYITNQIKLSNDGPKKIISHLEKENIASDIYLQFLDLNSSIWEERITKYLEKQLHINKKSEYLFHNKMMINLINLGYDKEVIESQLNKVHVNNQDNLKEIEEKKLRIKLARKYQNEELERKIREKLIAKGFFE